MFKNPLTLLLSLLAFVATLCMPAPVHAVDPPPIGVDAIGGTVTGPNGPEAGVWVIAESDELTSRYVKIVVTDELGRFVLPEMPEATFKVWTRGYGLVDSEPVMAKRSEALELKATPAGTSVQAAQYYPASYWFSMIRMPGKEEFPGTGPNGNGIAPAMKTQQHWIAHTMENCQFCHQLGTKATREIPTGIDPVQAWDQRILKDRSPDDVFFDEDDDHFQRNYAARMSNLMTLYGRERGLEMYADWTSRIAAGEVPPSPQRPTGVERNIVITMWDMAGGRFLHDTVSSDKRNPTVNSGGPVYGTAQFSGMVASLDPSSGEQKLFKLTDLKGDYAINTNNHTPMMDGKGRVWMTMAMPQGDNPDYCTDGSNLFAKYFPREAKQGKVVGVFDPATESDEAIPVCFGSHHLNFDSNNRVYFSGDTEVVGWVDTDTWDKTKDAGKSIGWCPFVLDTNGDGRITPDRTGWNERMEGSGGGEGADLGAGTMEAAGDIDPSKDTRIAGFNYAIGVSPTDQAYWAAKYTPILPSGILRVHPGAKPPETCITEYYEPPKKNGEYVAFDIRGVDVDKDGIAWVAFGSGAIGRFDRSACKVTNGPTATGQHCPEGWEIIESPGPKYPGTNAGSDWFYLVFVDHHNTLGLGEGVPILPNSVADEFLAYLPDSKEFVRIRVPYPMGFYARSLDGRIDDPESGWKGRGIWTSNNTVPIWHTETGEGSSEVAAHIQLRPDPLAQ